MFFHSFPRPPRGEPVDEDKGLKILANILQSGLLLAPEVVDYPAEYSGGNNYRLVQSRFCLTQLDDLESLERHADHFGTFHLEFADKTVYSLGAIPVMYLPKRSKQPDADSRSAPLADLGSFFIHRLLELQNICARMEQLEKILLANRFNGVITINDETGGTYTVNVKQAKTILNMLCRDIEPFDQIPGITPFNRIQGAVQGLASLFYPADMDYTDKKTNKSYYEQLYFFRQREWRVIRGVRTAAQQIDEGLNPEEKAALLEIDPVFYGKGDKELEFINGKKPKICECSVIKKLDGRPVWEKIAYIIVPAAKLEAARELAKNMSVRDRIIDLETRKDIMAKTDTEKKAGRG
jgi:hypothetical protein